MGTMEQYFNPDGLLREVFPRYEYRKEQLRMARAVMDSLTYGKTLIVEAGTGVGKSMAYLVPLCLALLEGTIERAVVSTYTKALQRQLVEKDLPRLKETLFPSITYHLCLGSENYLCKRRLRIAVETGNVDIFEEEEFNRLLEWLKDTESGLLLELSPPVSLWRKVCRESDLCHGRACGLFSECHYQHSKRMERQSGILVTNHHLLFTHIASGWNILPGFDAIVFDEAHEIEDVASDYLGLEVSDTALKYMLDSLLSRRGKGYLARLKDLDRTSLGKITTVMEQIRQQGHSLFSLISREIDDGYRTRKLTLDDRYSALKETLVNEMGELSRELYELGRKYSDTEEGKDLRILADRFRYFAETLDAIVEQTHEGYVYWVTQEGRKTKAVATPIEMGQLLNAQLFQVIERVVLTSATLTVEGSFEYIRERLGIESADTLCLDSPFEYERQVSLYIPEDIPDPKDDGYIDAVSAEINSIVSCTEGRALILFTSYSMLEEVSRRIKGQGLNILKQGDADSYSLIEEFKSHGNSLLLGTYTFWQGIDIPGDALRCVVITKLPFSVPTDPVVEARMEALTRRGGDPFYHYQVPNAVIRFRQGFGRLIRSYSDSGLVAVLDSRVLKRRYGQVFLKSLPRVRVIKSLSGLKG